MTNKEILSHIDHTKLSAYSCWDEIDFLCKEAVRFSTAGVCIPPYYVRKTRENYPSLNICTVIGFPLGYQTAAVKAAETREAVNDGADEIDMVINICMVKDGDFDAVKDEIKQIRSACAGKILKVIIETCYLTDDEKIRLCEAVTEAGADYIKTSTGFGTGGAHIEDIELFKKHIGSGVRIKAAGGIRTRESMEMFIEAGCDRIGTSSAAVVFEE